MGADSGSFPAGSAVLAAGSDWKSTAGPCGRRQRSAGITRLVPPEGAGEGTLGGQESRRPTQKQGGAQRILQTGHRWPAGLAASQAVWWRGWRTQPPGDPEQSAERSHVVEGNRRLLLSEPAGVWGELLTAEGQRGAAGSQAQCLRPPWTSLMLVGTPQHTRVASDTGSQTAGAGDTHAGCLLSLYRRASTSHAFPPSHLAVWGTKGSQQRGKWVFRAAVWERWEDTEHVGRNGLLAVQVQCSLLQMIL